MRHFTRRSTTDYFIHRDLKGFLLRELEFFIKDQILHLGDLEGDLPARLRVLRTVRTLAAEVTEFLAQLEEVQRRLFEKRKLVLRTDWLVLIKDVPRALWPEVLRNEAQLHAWKELFGIDPEADLLNAGGEVNEHFLMQHPTLVVNTEYFREDPTFVDQLLEGFEGDLDAATGGVLIQSENYQALRLLQRRYSGEVKCIYIDPPYNTGSDDFVYKDRYQHSSWLTMMEERLRLARGLMGLDGAIFLQIDDNESANISQLLDSVFGSTNFRNSIIVRRGVKNVQSQFESISALSVGHDVIYLYTNTADARLPKAYQHLNSAQPGKWDTFWRGTDRPTMRYELFGHKPQTGQWRWSETRARAAVRNYEEYLKKQARNPDLTLDDHYTTSLEETGGKLNFVRLNEDGVVQYYVPPTGVKLLSDLWVEVPTRGSFADFATEKNTALLEQAIGWVTTESALTMDFFGGSGSTAHAVVNLNRNDDLCRRFILVEVGGHFREVLLPRLEKVLYTPEWKNDKPARLPTPEEAARTPRLVKVLRLESYEDALHNLTTDEALRRAAPREAAHREVLGEDAYRLRYLARLPLEANPSLLHLDRLEHPFHYTIEVLEGDGPREEVVDLVETFNLAYGLRVERRERWMNPEDAGRLYRAVYARDPRGRRVLVFWRDVEGLDPAVERRWLEPRLAESGPWDDALCNADSATPGVRSLDPEFKRLMSEPEEGV